MTGFRIRVTNVVLKGNKVKPTRKRRQSVSERIGAKRKAERQERAWLAKSK